MERRARVLVVMMTDGVTIVIVPMTALRADMMDRCNKTKIECAVWDGKRPPYSARIVLVTPESAVSKAFGRFLDEKMLMKQLDRIVIDECHTVLESTKNWRPKVLKLIEMAQKEVQVVYLTATLKPTEEERFLKVVGVKRKDIDIFRESTTRENIAYDVVECEEGQNVETATKELVERKRRQYEGTATGGSIIVYAGSINAVKRLAQELGCPMYHSKSGTQAQKERLLQRLKEGKEKVIVATNGLGLGVDAPQVRVVIHACVRRQLKEYIQESGRAGRDGRSSEAIIVKMAGSTGS
jgi:superfamily II DNA helicase RecQ